MLRRFICTITLIFSSLSFLIPSELVSQPKDFYLTTIPKSGSHLMIKLLTIMTGKYPHGLIELFNDIDHITNEEFEKVLNQVHASNHFAFNHIGKFGELFLSFSQQHPEYLKLLTIRDLRDIFVSYTYHIRESLVEQFGPKAFDEQLKLVLDLDSGVSLEIKKDIETAIEWIKMPDVQTFRFEDIVGEKGLGDAEQQRMDVARLASKLGVELTDALLKEIEENLWGNERGPEVAGTFRSGKIGGWKSHFNEEHLNLFNKFWKEYNQALGY